MRAQDRLALHLMTSCGSRGLPFEEVDRIITPIVDEAK